MDLFCTVLVVLGVFIGAAVMLIVVTARNPMMRILWLTRRINILQERRLSALQRTAEQKNSPAVDRLQRKIETLQYLRRLLAERTLRQISEARNSSIGRSQRKQC